MTETPSLTEVKLTGKFRFKKNFWGSMVLWVEEKTTYWPNFFDDTLKRVYKKYRKADEFDVAELTTKFTIRK